VRTKLPDRLAAGFWLNLAIAALWFALASVGWAMEQGGKILIAVVFGVLFLSIAVKRFRDVRLARRLQGEPEFSRLYYGRKAQ
jgi:uncharacterized membrane protein